MLKSTGNNDRFYEVPDDKIVKVGLLNLVNISIGDEDRFNTMEETPVIATREGTLLDANLLGNDDLAAVKVNVLNYKTDSYTNVLINGHYKKGIKILGLTHEIDAYKDIDFKKLAVMGNSIIQQAQGDTVSRRFFL